MSMSVGGDNHLHVVLSKYQPNVQCRGTIGPEWNSCKDILGDMPAGKAPTVFGPRTDKSVQQGLPMTYDSGKILGWATGWFPFGTRSVVCNIG